MEIDSERQKRMLGAIVSTVVAHVTELTDLDRAIGDGDHGVNLQRGVKAIAQQLDEFAALPLGQALHDVGKRLVMTVGGASGPLYGTLFMVLGKHLADTELSRDSIVAACEAAVAAVKARGKSDVGQKTLLDVLVPVELELRTGSGDMLERLPETARSAATATIDMVAKRGRAAFLRERSVGHMDPGARSSQLMIAAVCESLQRGAESSS